MRRALSRRNFVRGALASAAILELQQTAKALGFGAAAPICKLEAEQEVGPFYLTQGLLRADIREGKAGVPLALHVAVLDARTCRPLSHAAVDVWHCDAMGAYSGFTAQPGGFGGPGGHGGPPPPPRDFDRDRGDLGPEYAGVPPGPASGFPPSAPKPTDALRFLRGIQITDREGIVNFQTIFPGFYPGRTNHIHFKVRLAGDINAPDKAHFSDRTYEAGHVSHTGQIFFPEDMAADLMRQGPYAKHTIERVKLSQDGVFLNQNGVLSLAEITQQGGEGRSHRLTAKLIVAVDPEAVPAPAQRGPGHHP